MAGMTESTAAAELLARFRRQRPLRGGSLIVTIFGDALMPRGGAVTLGSLIALAEPFGLNERLVRTAAARLAKEGWLQARRAGKLSEYHLSSDGRERFAEATKRIYSEPDSPWSGRWTVIVLPPMRAADRKELKEELTWRGFGELSTNVFAHPEPDSQSLNVPQSPAVLLSKAIVFDANLAGDHAPQRLVSLGWDLEDLGLRYQRFVKRFERVLTAVQETPRHGRSGVLHRANLVDPRIPPPAFARSHVARGLVAGQLARRSSRGAVPGYLRACVPGVRAVFVAGCGTAGRPLACAGCLRHAALRRYQTAELSV